MALWQTSNAAVLTHTTPYRSTPVFFRDKTLGNRVGIYFVFGKRFRLKTIFMQYFNTIYARFILLTNSEGGTRPQASFLFCYPIFGPWNRIVTVESCPRLSPQQNAPASAKKKNVFCWKKRNIMLGHPLKKLDGGEMETYHSAGAADCGRCRQQASVAGWLRLGTRSKLRRGTYVGHPLPPVYIWRRTCAAVRSWHPSVKGHHKPEENPRRGKLNPTFELLTGFGNEILILHIVGGTIAEGLLCGTGVAFVARPSLTRLLIVV